MARVTAVVVAGVALCGVVSLRAARPQSSSVPPAASHAAPASAPDVRPVLDKYCVGCHNERRKASYANLALDSLDVKDIGAHAATWEKVVSKLRAGTMPPGGVTRPDKGTYDAVVASLETALDAASAGAPNPGHPVIHRLNRTEYVNAVRDLLAVEIDGPTYLPPDNSGFGFDNIGDVLSISPSLLDRYMSTARKIARLAIGDSAIRPVSTFYKVPTLLVQEDRRNDELPFGTRGGLSVRHTFPLDGEYAIRVDFTKDYGDQWRGRHEDSVADVRVDGERVKQFLIAKSTRNTSIMASDGQKPNPGPQEVRFAAKAGTHTITVAFVKRTVVTEGVGPDRLPVGSTSYGQLGTTSVTNGKIESGVQNIEVIGPFNATAPAETPSRKQIFVCRPTSKQDEESCARQIISKLARRAYRRPSTANDVGTLLTFYKQGRATADFDAGIESALERVLIAPAFLFRSEHDGKKASADRVEPVSDVDLASRLSFFLWSSIPDDELLSLAERGRLHEPATLEQQVKRMMADARSDALLSNFFGQWLMLRNVDSQLPNYLIYPEFDDNLREAFRTETELFLQSQVREDHSALDLLTANYTFVNERLAKHYGISNVYGSHFRRVTYPDAKRAGLLGQGSVLLVTAYRDRSSPVFRGKWLLENILGTPPPMPPKNVPPFPENDGKAPKSVRARMEKHRSNPVCASCHTQIDPLGFGLENFDGIGRWRDTDSNSPVDASGQFPNGLKFKDAADFRQGLMTGYKSEFVSTLTKKLTTYALGRGVESYDMPAVRKIVRDAAASDYRWSSLILGIVKSMPFQMRRSES
jgi:hypothetical protein